MTPREIEATFLDIDKTAFRAQLRSLSGELVQEEKLMRRVVFDISDHSFARVRDEGNKITMSYKCLESHTLSGMQEICLEVNDYNLAIALLEAVGLKIKAEQESYREEWLLDGVEVTIDTWPWLPPYTELEGPSEEAVKSVAMKLGFDMQNAIFGSVDEVYKIYYNVTENDVNYAPLIKFGPQPDWIAGKARPEFQEKLLTFQA